MLYLDIVNLIYTILSTLMGLLTVHFVVFFIVGLFKRKKFAPAEKKCKYGIVVSARNEQEVIGNLIESIRKCKYPQDKIQIFIVAHNCTDGTAQVARDAGAIVYEYNNENEKTKGYALRYLFKQIERDFGTGNFDGFFLLDADNVLAEDYIDKMNDAFVANNCEKVITSFRNAKNFGENLMTALYGIYFIQGCVFESKGRTVLGCTTRVSGTGFLFSSEVVKDGWNYLTITEDWEFSADQILRNNKIVYCDEAEFFDEQPTKTKIMLRQRLRWSRGHLLVCLTRFKNLLKSLFTPKSKGGGVHKFSIYDFTVLIMPLMVMSLIILITKPICLAFAPLFGYDAAAVWIDWAIGTAESAAVYYLSIFLSGIIMIISERKRIVDVSTGLLILAVFVYPIFLALSVLLGFIALFVKNLKWKTIPHGDKQNIDDLKSKKKAKKSEAKR